jgi:UDP-N-acetylmuramate--alanine ligase
MRLKYGIVIAGSHGKTTTTSLVAAVLAAGGLDPTVVVGGRALATGTNAQLGAGEYLVAEADESDGSFLRLTPTVAVVTNIDLEHVDYYTDLDSLRQAFATFLERVPFYGACVLCVDDPEVRALAPQVARKVLTYGLGIAADIHVDGEVNYAADGRQIVELNCREQALGNLRLPVRGRHNLQNALAAVAVGVELGISWSEIKSGLEEFKGVGRRCEDKGEHGGVLVLDDYGHHPTEVLATLEVARSFGRRVVVLFQPHRYSRTAHFAREFADALALADCVGLLPVYAASEEPLSGVSSELIASALADKKLQSVEIVAGSEEVPVWLNRTVRSGDLLLTLGAGDIGRMVARICELCAQRS